MSIQDSRIQNPREGKPNLWVISPKHQDTVQKAWVPKLSQNQVENSKYAPQINTPPFLFLPSQISHLPWRPTWTVFRDSLYRMQPQFFYHKRFPRADWNPCSHGLLHRCMQSKPLPNRRTLLYPKDGMRSLGYHQHHHPRARQWQDSLLSLHHSITIRSLYEALVGDPETLCRQGQPQTHRDLSDSASLGGSGIKGLHHHTWCSIARKKEMLPYMVFYTWLLSSTKY